MEHKFPYAQFLSMYPDDGSCLEEIKRLKFPSGIYCTSCQKATRHYRLRRRVAYACKECRTQVYPLKDTIMEKTTSPLATWFFAMFLMTHTFGKISVKDLQKETGVTYKTAWRMHKNIMRLMSQNKGDLLKELSKRERSTHKWTIFRRFEITLTQKNEEEKANEL